MDKSTIIAKTAQEPEDRLLLAKVLDKYEQSQRKNIPAATLFLSPREQQLVQALLNAAGVRSGYVLDGGYEEAERKIAVFLPGWAEDAEGELVFLRASFHGQDSALTHRDILGSLMGLGLTFQVGLQAVLNICVVTNTIPNTGISLPFFSSGGTALLMLLGQMGILLNISRSSNVEKT